MTIQELMNLEGLTFIGGKPTESPKRKGEYSVLYGIKDNALYFINYRKGVAKEAIDVLFANGKTPTLDEFTNLETIDLWTVSVYNIPEKK